MESYNCTVVLKYERLIKMNMKKIDYDTIIANKQRRSMQAVIDAKDLTVTPWAESAGLTEGAVRNFLSGKNTSMTTVNAQKLASQAGVTIQRLLSGDDQNIRAIAGCIKNGAKIYRQPRNPTEKELEMLMGAEYSADAEIFSITTEQPSPDDGTLVVFENKITSDFDRYLKRKVLVKIRGGEEIVKILHRGNEPHKYTLQSYGITGDQSPLIENVKLEWCALVKNIICS